MCSISIFVKLDNNSENHNGAHLVQRHNVWYN